MPPEVPGPLDPGELVARLREVATLGNDDLMAGLDIVLLEVERRLLHYARVGPEMLGMADEGLVLAVRSAARLRQAQSATAHATVHLQTVGVGEWKPTGTNPSWSDDPRVIHDHDTGHGHAHD